MPFDPRSCTPCRRSRLRSARAPRAGSRRASRRPRGSAGARPAPGSGPKNSRWTFVQSDSLAVIARTLAGVRRSASMPPRSRSPSAIDHARNEGVKSRSRHSQARYRRRHSGDSVAVLRDNGRRRPSSGVPESEPMTRSIERILTTHVGSLPRSAALVALLYKKEDGEPYDHSAFDAAIATAVDEVVAKQAEIGIDIVSDGRAHRATARAIRRHRRPRAGARGHGLRLRLVCGLEPRRSRHRVQEARRARRGRGARVGTSLAITARERMKEGRIERCGP